MITGRTTLLATLATGVAAGPLDIPPQLLGIGAGWALVALFAILVFRGDLVPRKSVEEIKHDRDEWRTESRIKDQQIAEKDVQIRYVSEVGETVKAVLTALQDAGRRT